MTKTLIFSMPGNQDCAENLCRELDWEMGALQVHRFPDGESNPRFLTSVAGREIAIVCTLDHPDEKILVLYLVAQVARELGAVRVGLIVPYLPYMRQDARFHEGEGITSIHFSKLLSECGDWLVTVDPHLHRHHDLSSLYSVPTRVVHASIAISEWIVENVLHPIIIGPDVESEQWVAEVARAVGCPYRVLQKTRHSDEDVDVSVPDGMDMRGRTPVLVDDIASTAHTLIAAIWQLNEMKYGGTAPICVVVHALFAERSYTELQATGVQQIVSCNTVLHASNRIDVCKEITISIKEFM